MGQIGRETQLLFVDSFIQNYRLDGVTELLGYHKDYLDVYCRTHNFILKGDGPLPYHYRHYIAIMAAGRHQCSFLINHQKQEFLMQCGDPTWLQGLQYIPKKLRDLYEINKILAHRPWLLNVSHIERLTKGADSWSLAELVHAIVLLAHFHSLSSFIFGCGINEEIDHEYLEVLDLDVYLKSEQLTSSQKTKENHVKKKQQTSPTPTPTSTTLSSTPGMPLEELMQRMKLLSERVEEFTQEEKTKRFEHVENQSIELSSGLISSSPQLINDSMKNFIDDPLFIYQDFAKRSDTPIFRVQDYSWDDQGYSLVNRLYNDVGTLLDEKFKTAYNLTYFMMGGRKQVDTSHFRRAIWNYIQCMFGIRHDDYDYGEVNQLLERSVKSFIKMACCYPELVKPKDYERIMREFEHSEKIHVNLMVMEARMQAELLYALRAVMRYQT